MRSKHIVLRKVAGVTLALLMMLLWGQGAVWAEGGTDTSPPVETQPAPQAGAPADTTAPQPPVDLNVSPVDGAPANESASPAAPETPVEGSDNPTPSTPADGGTDPAPADIPADVTALQTSLSAEGSDDGLTLMCINPGSIGDYVWLDTDKDGIQDSGEDGIHNVTVKLYKNSVYQGQDITNHDGKYRFGDLEAGTYKVKFPDITNFAFTHQDAGTDDAKDSDAGSDGNTANITLAAGQHIDTVDCGYVCRTPCSLGDFVWNDANGNGIQDTGETGINSVTVQLYKNGGVVASDVTDTSGLYKFEGLDAGTYQVKFPSLSGKAITAKDAGGNDTKDSDADTATGMTGDIVLSWGDCNTTVDCGYRVPASLGDYAWHDVNGNGIQDDGASSGVAGLTVALCQGGVQINTTTTNASGYYQFTGLAAGTYQVRFPDRTASGFGFTTPNATGDTLDSDADAATGYSPAVTLTWGGCNMTVDCGYKDLPKAALGDFVWHDGNGNGMQDAGEAGISGLTVKLYKGGIKVGETATDASGLYHFTGLDAGVYQVRFPAPAAGQDYTTLHAGSDAALDSDAGAGGVTVDITLDWGETDNTIDCGYADLTKAALGDLVWYDLNGNGVQDSGETGISGVTVELYQGGSIVDHTTSGSLGFYHFTGLDAGTYIVKFPALFGMKYTLPDVGDDALDSDVAVSGSSSAVTLDWGDNNTTIDCGYAALPKAFLGDFVWEDLNFNGYQDSGEPGIGGVTVELYQGQTKVTETTTDSSGLYHFSNLDAGDYKVKFYPVSGMSLSSADLGDDAHDSDAGISGMTPVVTLDWGENDTSVDCGMAVPGSVGDYVWLDTNKNGVQNAGEPPVPGVTVKLCNGNVVAASDTTDSNGHYLFENVMPGSYHIEFVLPPNGTLGYTGFAFTGQCVAGSTEANDSNPDGTGCCTAFSLASRQNLTGEDAGLVADWGSIGDFVWQDNDKDGIQDQGEPGIGGVTVKLYAMQEQTPSLLKTTVTNTVGGYLFDLLPFGEYKVQFIKPAGYDQTLLDAGADTVDSDAGVDGYTAPVVLNSDHVNDMNVDAGYYPATCCLGDRVWLDTNWNGQQDAGEAGVNGITVELYQDGMATPVATAVTANHAGQDGWYNFAALPGGTYRVKFTINAAQYLITGAHAVGDDVDSDADVTSGFSPWVALDTGTHRDDLTVDAGLKVPCSIGDYVWLDAPKTGLPGVQESGEPGKNGVKVELYRQVNGAMQLVASTVTASHEGKDGWYTFTGLQEGVYQVQFLIQEDGYEFVPYHMGTDVTKDSDAGVGGLSPLVTLSLAANRNDATIDAGVRIPSTGGLPAEIFFGAGGVLVLAGAGLSMPFFLRRRQRIAAALRGLVTRMTAMLVRK